MKAGFDGKMVLRNLGCYRCWKGIAIMKGGGSAKMGKWHVSFRKLFTL
jgi:hypothetical protein